MLDQLQDVFKFLNAHEVRYVVIGGVAAAIHGVPRATFDVDFLIDATPQNAAALLKAFEEASLGTASLINAEQLLANEITVFNDRIRIDVQTATPGLTFKDAWTDRVTCDHGGQSFYVASKQHIIQSKEAAARPVDLEDARILRLESDDPPPSHSAHS